MNIHFCYNGGNDFVLEKGYSLVSMMLLVS